MSTEALQKKKTETLAPEDEYINAFNKRKTARDELKNISVMILMIIGSTILIVISLYTIIISFIYIGSLWVPYVISKDFGTDTTFIHFLFTLIAILALLLLIIIIGSLSTEFYKGYISKEKDPQARKNIIVMVAICISIMALIFIPYYLGYFISKLTGFLEKECNDVIPICWLSGAFISIGIIFFAIGLEKFFFLIYNACKPLPDKV
jgi:hypothetical protein